jgi:hypothetical protein
MATFTYWVAPLWRDPAYSIVGKTKKAVKEQLDQVSDPENYDAIEKRTFNYKDAFDMFEFLTGEGGGRITGLKA